MLPATLRHPSRRLLVAAWLAIAAQLATAAGALLVGPGQQRPDDRGPGRLQGRGVAGIFDGTAPSGDRVDQTTRTRQVRALLATRARAVLRRDRTAFLGTIAPEAARVRARQAAWFDNIAAVPLGSWRYRLDPRRERLLPPGVTAAYGEAVWAPRVELRYELAGYDAAPTSQQQRLLFVRRGERWYLADDGLGDNHPVGTGTVRNLWDFGRVEAVRGPSVLVLGHPGAEPLLRSVYEIVARAIPEVTAVWGEHWRRRVVVLVPDSADELGQLVEEPGDLSQMAAFTSADVPRDGQPAGQRVVVNPAAFARLSPHGRRVVLTHEITHVATASMATREPAAPGAQRRSTGHLTSGATPYWLAEGFADYVAYRGTDTPVRRAARELAREVRAGRLPQRLPVWSDFQADSPRLAQAYQEAWLACRLIARRGGEQTLVRLYRQLSRSSGDPEAALDAALRDELGMDTEEFVAAWRRYLVRQVGDE